MQNSNIEIIEREHNFIYQTYKRLPIVIDKAEGARIYTKSGEVYLDFLSGIAVNALGHSHPKIIEAVRDQINKYMHVSNYFYQEPQIELAEKLLALTGLDKVFFTNSGTEATEGAIKLTRKWANTQGKKEIIAFSGGFHGRTYGALSIMDKPLYKDGMGPFLDGCKVIPLNDTISLMESITANTAAVCIEYLQGEGGINEPSPDFNELLNELHKQHGFVLIADEIQAGIGRTGKMFAYEHFGAKPDIVTVAKGMGGGLPLGGIITSIKLSNVWSKGNHGTTYGGNAVACRTGSVVIDLLENGLLNHVNIIGNYLHQQLKEIMAKHPQKVLQVRGRGLMKGLLLSFDAQFLVDELLKNKVIANAASGFVLRIVPPFIIDENDVDEFVRLLDISLSALSE